MSRIAVAAPSRVITDSAMAIANEGGSVVDVGIVAALAAMCTEPGVCGPGGGGFMAVSVPGADPVVIDGYMSYPGIGFDGDAFTREVTMTYGGGLTTVVDAGSIAVPGAFAAFGLASEIYGVAPWSLLMEAVAVALEDGFPLSRPAHFYLTEGAAPIYSSDPVARDALFDDGHPKALGSTIVFEGLAETLRYIGKEGADVFYRGDLGASIADDLAQRGGVLTRADLEQYEAVARKPVTRKLGPFDLALNPPPAIGGIIVDRVLSEFETHTTPWPVGLVEALIDAFKERLDGSLLSPSTISVASADDEGGAVAASFSAGYGSGVIPKGTGMLMNNALGELELVTPGEGKPGERMLSNMAPTLAMKDGECVAIGSPGADRITSAVATTLARLARGDRLDEAIERPRAHPEFGEHGVRVALEPGPGIDAIEYPVRQFDDLHMFFGGVNGAGVLDGELQAHADSRRTGSVAYTG